MNFDAFNSLVRHLYAASNGQESWDNIVNKIGDGLDLGVIHLFLTDFGSNTAFVGASPRGDPGLDMRYQLEYSQYDFRLPRIEASKPGLLFDERSITSPDEIKKSPLHQELFVKNDIHKIVGSNLSVGQAFGWFGATTRKASDDFSDLQLQVLGRLTQHFLQAFEICKTKAELLYLKDTNAQALDHFDLGLILLKNNKIRYFNERAELFVNSGLLASLPGLLYARRASEAAGSGGIGFEVPSSQEFRLTDPDTGKEFFVTVKQHVNLSGFYARDEMLVLVRSVEEPFRATPEAAARFGVLHGLSEAETATVQAILSNEPLTNLAEERGVKIDTVRKQLKSAMKKLRVNAQKDIILKFFQSSSFNGF